MNQEEFIIEAKNLIKRSILKDNLIIFFTRVLEDLKKNENSCLFGRIKDLYYLINPYQDSTKKEIYSFFKNDFVCNEGLILDDEEKLFCNVLFSNLREDFILINGKVMKGRILGIIKRLILKYFPNSSDIVEPFIFAKLICSVGGVDRLIQLPSSTIQLIGAEKALFRHKSKKTNSPKYGLLYLSRKIQESSNKGKATRQISNKLFISIKLDYYQIIAQ